ncbi:MAG: UvrB/UvrC motif-containing protein [Candidatus Pacebacteria bacterium]|nr:UvrB/UvrC motif-containing protein [Candidatus Paceibacterota bacterium]
MNLIDLKKINLPDAPGVYRFMHGKNILYIGKATSLRDRVRSYFSNDLLKTRGALILDMATRADNMEFTQTDSVLEALILEADLIKKFQPLANTKEKDNKSYSFVVITKEKIPRVLIERGRTLSFDPKGYQEVFGPFPSQMQLREALKIIRKIFPFRSDESDSRLYRQLGLNPDTADKEAVVKYKSNLRHIKLFFKGKKKELNKQLEKEMKALAKAQDFEGAAKKRNQIFALNHIKDVSLLKHDNEEVSGFRIEAYDAAHLSGKNSVGVMTVMENGAVQKSAYRKFILRKAARGDDVGSLEEILSRRLAHTEWPDASLIIVDGSVAQRNRALKILKEAGKNIPVVGVVKNEAHKPQSLLGDENIIKEYKRSILLVNNEAHRFAIDFYRQKQRRASYKQK